jgi:hypothetical protein
MRIVNLITAISLLSGFAVATTAFAMAEKNENVVEEPVMYNAETNEPIPHVSSDYYEVNEYGQTFGSTLDVMYVSDYPDLVAVLGDNGIRGYAYQTDLDGEQPSCPEEAVRMMEERERNGNPPRVINVYESDGRTVIDTFTIG